MRSNLAEAIFLLLELRLMYRYKVSVVFKTIEHSIEGGGIIVMDDIIMAITVHNDQDLIAQVVVSRNDIVVFHSNECNSNDCTFDLSELEKGNYTATVYTEKGNVFSAPILV